MQTQRIALNLVPEPGMAPKIYLSQYDDRSRRLEFELYDGTYPYDIPSATSIVIQGTKPDKKGFQYDCEYADGVASCIVAGQMTACCGNVLCELVLSKDGSILGTANFVIVVERAALSDDTVISRTDMPMIEEAAKNALLADASAKDAAASASAAGASETNAKASETAAKTSETNAASSATAAANSAAASQKSVQNAETNARSAQSSAEKAAESASRATESASNAEDSEGRAAESADAAGKSAAASEESASGAATSATNASKSAASAKTSADNAASSEANARNSATAASESAKSASDSATDSSRSASASAKSASDAASSATAAAESAKKSEDSAKSAQTLAGDAAGSAASASGSATAASASAKNAADSASEAQKYAGSMAWTTEQHIITDFILGRTGKVYRTRFYKHNVNTSSSGTKLDANKGLVCEPSSSTTEGRDDYADIPSFKWYRCNYVCESDGFKRITALEGAPSYATEGAVDVGTLHPTFYWGVDKHDDYYDIIYSDTPHEDLGLKAWKDALRGDGVTVMPYWIESSYASVIASDSLLRSQPGKAPAYNQSYNNMITNYQKKGAGYWGAGIARNTYAIIMMAIKYATKNSQSVMQGCCAYNTQATCAVAETGVKRVIIASQGDFIAGGCVSVGVANGTSTDRGLDSISSIADRVLIKSIETVTVDGKDYIALNLDIDGTIDTTTSTYVSTMPQYTGTTDAVIGHHDGQAVIDRKHTLRIQGQEYMWGQYVIASDTVMDFQSDYSKNVYVYPAGAKHLQNSYSGAALVGNIPNDDGNDWWVGDMDFDPASGAAYPKTIGTGDSVGCGDRVYSGGKSSGTREYLMNASLWNGSDAGLCMVGCRNRLWSAYWDFASCD